MATTDELLPLTSELVALRLSPSHLSIIRHFLSTVAPDFDFTRADVARLLVKSAKELYGEDCVKR